MRDTGFCFSYFATFRTSQQVHIFVVHVGWTAFEGVYLIENRRNSLLFGYHELGFRCLELNLFSRCFDLKALKMNKCFESYPASRLTLEHKRARRSREGEITFLSPLHQTPSHRIVLLFLACVTRRWACSQAIRTTYVVYFSKSDSSVLRNKHLFLGTSKAIHSKPSIIREHPCVI